MRKAGKKRIEAALADFEAWAARIDTRISQIVVPGAADRIRIELDSIRDRIKGGDLTWSTQAHIRSMLRWVEGCEDGFYKSATIDGTWTLS